MAFALNDRLQDGVTDPDRSVTIKPSLKFRDTTEIWFDYVSDDLNFPFDVLFKKASVRIEWQPGKFVDQQSPYEAVISVAGLRRYYFGTILQDPAHGEKAYAEVLQTIEQGLVCMVSPTTERTGIPLKVIFES